MTQRADGIGHGEGFGRVGAIVEFEIGFLTEAAANRFGNHGLVIHQKNFADSFVLVVHGIESIRKKIKPVRGAVHRQVNVESQPLNQHRPIQHFSGEFGKHIPRSEDDQPECGHSCPQQRDQQKRVEANPSLSSASAALKGITLA